MNQGKLVFSQLMAFLPLSNIFVHDAHGIKVFGHGGDVTQLGRNRRHLGTGQEHVGVLGQAVGKIAGAGGHNGGLKHGPVDVGSGSGGQGGGIGVAIRNTKQQLTSLTVELAYP